MVDAFTIALKTSVKEGDLTTATTLSAHTLNDITENIPQIESDHSISSLTSLNRSKKTQDVNFFEPNNVSDNIIIDKSDLSQTSITAEEIIPNTSHDYTVRDLGPTERGQKGNNDLFGDVTSPQHIASKPGNTIKWEGGSGLSNAKGITVGTLASFLRPIGVIRKLDNETGDLASVAFNSLYPLVNEGASLGGSMKVATDIIKGSKTVIPTTPDGIKKCKLGLILMIYQIMQDMLVFKLLEYLLIM